ncbi:MAG: polysaccharide biosynthesis tyrosine autokinase [Candidatus Aminicenantes bacterium]|nr:polysaccharide biosynthesis tyrosine autokinase [Candidatus Aminicenantes bacterium]
MEFDEYPELEKESKEIDLMAYLRMLLKRKWIIISFATAVIVLVGISTFTETPMYRASATLLIKDASSDMLSISDIYGTPYRAYDYMNRDFNTQLRLLTSRALAERVAVRMNLKDRPEIRNPIKRRGTLIQSLKNIISFQWVFRLIPRRKTPGKIQVKRNAPTRKTYVNPNIRLSGLVRGGLGVSPIEDTRMITLSYSSPYPALASDIVNNVAEEFINFSIETRYEATQQASDFLTEQIVRLREDLATKERELQKYGEQKNILVTDSRGNAVVNKFSELSSALTQAQIDRINKEAYYREMKDLRIDSLPQFVSNPLIQSMKTQYLNLKSEYDQKSQFFKSDYPEMKQLKARLDSISEDLKSEIFKAVEAAESEYRSSLKKESSLRDLMQGQRKEVTQMSNDAILYNSIRIEVENKRGLLNSLVAKQNEALISARLSGFKTSNIKIVDKALVPGGPYSPNIPRSLMMAIMVGLFGGIGLCFLLEYLDNSIKGPDDVEKLAGLPSLGIIPYLSPDGMQKKKYRGYYSYRYGDNNPGETDKAVNIKEIELINHLHPSFSISEDYRTVRTSIMLSHAESPPKSIVFTSCFPGEGKTSTVVNLAVSFAQLGRKILIIDSDLRKPRIHRIFRIRNIGGLSEYLTGKVDEKEVFKKTDIKNIWCVPSGPIPPNPAELLNSSRMKTFLKETKKVFDVVLLDASPVLAVIDPVILSSVAEDVVFIVQAGKTSKKPFVQAINELKRAKAKPLGVVFNEAKMARQGYGSHYYHYYRHRYYTAPSKPEPAPRRKTPVL